MLLKAMATDPRLFAQAMQAVPSICSAYRFARTYRDTVSVPDAADLITAPGNPLWEYCRNHQEGPGIWKWEHYFEIYHRHFAQFVGKEINLLEIGVYSGGSLQMWRSYLGDKVHVYGVDIEAACKKYANDHVSIFIGDQADRAFWNTFRESVESIDILIDDGGHTPEQQQITLEEMLPHIRPGGVYVCEDVHGFTNRFASFASSLVNELNRMQAISDSFLESSASRFQSSVHSIHFYPYLVVIEKHRLSPTHLASTKHGTEWQPFL